MISKFVKEQKRYSRGDLEELFETAGDTLVRMIKRLKEYGVLKTVCRKREQLDMSDLAETDVEVVDEDDTQKKYLYVFTFVGIIVVEGRVLKCYPKYIFQKAEPVKELRQIVKVLKKCSAKEQVIRIHSDGGKDKSFNRLAAMVYLLNDYYENGVYTNDVQVTETNGSGEILWDRTVNDTYPVIQNGMPYYVELKTRKRVVNDYDFFKRLHEAVLTACSGELCEAGLSDILDLPEIRLTEETLADLGDQEELLYRLNGEMNIQFNTAKQNVLAVMKALLSHQGTLRDAEGFSLYGTNHFNLVWERVCAAVFRNKLNSKLCELSDEYGLEIQQEYKSRKDETLKEMIEKPRWTEYGDDGVLSAEAGDTLIPDIITLRCVGGVMEFHILDAKYYVASIEPSRVSGQPGIESVVKQYMYQLAYMKFLRAHGITRIRNYFLLPAEDGAPLKPADVHMEMMDSFPLERIQVRKLPAMKVYACYLNSCHMDTGELSISGRE